MSTDTIAERLESSARSIADTVGPATVAISRSGRGSGVVIAEGKVLTNAHNLRDRTTQVTFADGRTAQSSAAGRDSHGDLVVLDVDTSDITPVTWAEQTVTTGSLVIALARSGRGLRLSFGMVSGTDRGFCGPGGRPIAGSIEHSAPLAKGSSGGPLLDLSGALVGLNTHRIGDGFYLALPTDATLRARIERLSAGESPEQLSLGVVITPPHAAQRMRRAVGLEPRDGLLVRAVHDASPAATSGVRQGDLLVRAGSTELRGTDDLHAVLSTHDRSQPLALMLSRGTDEIELSVSFGVTPRASS